MLLKFYIITQTTTSVFNSLFFLLSLIFIILTLFFGLPILVYCDLNVLNSFNAIVFDNINSFYTGTFIEKPIFDRLYHYHNIELDIFSNKINSIIYDKQFIENYLNHAINLYVEKQKILTGITPSIEECEGYKNFLLDDLKRKSSLYTQGSGLEYTKKILKN
jgi:hypothetical protein